MKSEDPKSPVSNVHPGIAYGVLRRFSSTAKFEKFESQDQIE